MRSERTRERTEHAYVVPPDAGHGGSMFGGMFSGAFLAFGVMLIVGLLASAAGVWFGFDMTANVGRDAALQLGIGGGIALVATMFLAYLWGGYVGGRMAPGAGVLTGLLVAVAGLLIGGLLGLIGAAVGEPAAAQANMRIRPIPIETQELWNFGIGIGIASLVAMFGGALLGGSLADRWYGRVGYGYTATEVTHRDDEDVERTRTYEDAELRQSDRADRAERTEDTDEEAEERTTDRTGRRSR